MINCCHCGARQFNRRRTFCCSDGRHIINPDIVQEPMILHHFLEKYSRLLITHGRELNQLASFTSVGIKSTHRSFGGVQQRHDDTCFAQAEGKMYHFPLFDGGSRSHPLLGSATSYLFHETGTVTTFNERFTPDVIFAASELRAIMCKVNEHVKDLRHQIGSVPSTLDFITFLRSVPQLSISVAGNMNNSSTSRSQLCLLYSLGNDVFQRPSISATLPDVESKYINCEDHRYESMTYPLFDIYGRHGWFKYDRGVDNPFASTTYELNQMTDIVGNKLTLRQYIQYNFSQNQLQLSVPKLQQEWLLDQMSRSDSMNNPWYIQHMQNMEHLRTATRRQFMRNPDPQTVGHRTRIPSTVRGSQAYRREKVDMGMAHVYKYGPPTLFITMTANPEWPEIQNNLKPGQEWHHDVYLVNLVFKEKLDQLISGLKRGEFFNGRTSEWLQYAIEFQKRGLPHAHILVRLTGEQPSTAAEVDALSTVLYPLQCESMCGECKQCMLYYLVNKHMTHKCYPDRCKTRSTNASTPCGCKYGYPWQSNPVSFIGQDGKWILRRRPQEKDIVEYNAELLLRFRCHINVKVTTGTRCILYLRKYMSKGPDVAHVRLANQTCAQELNNFYETRCMTASEAAWSALNFDFQHYDPPVRLLSLHLQNEEQYCFDDRDEPDAILGRFKTPQLELYFQRAPPYADLTFEQYFSQCDVTQRTVRHRSSPIVTAVNTVRFHDSDHFALYMLLKELKPRSWTDIIGDCQSYTQRAQMLGLIGAAAGDTHRAVLNEMSQRHESSDNFLRYFIFIVNDCPRDFKELFDLFWQNMIDTRSARSFTRTAALCQLRHRFLQEGCTLIDMLQNASEDMIAEVEALPEVRDDQLTTFFTNTVSELPMSEEQRTAFNSISDIRFGHQRLFYVNGCAGSGKTHLLRQLTRKLFSEGHRVVCCAPTGIAASLLPNGFTCHKLFRIPVSEETDSNLNSLLTKSSNDVNARLLRMATVIVWDECSMVHRELFDLVNKVLKDVSNSELPFGGKTVIIAGDFNQQAPVLAGVDAHVLPQKTIDASIKFHPLFQTFTAFKLIHAHRFANQDWANFLLQTIAAGNGQPVPDQTFATHPDFSAFRDELRFVQPSAIDSILRHPAFDKPSAVQCIASTHELVNRFNERQTNEYFDEDELVSLPARYSYSGSITNHLHHDQIRQIRRKNVPDDELRLAVGMPVMVLRNINVRDGLCNGAIATVVSVDALSVEVMLQSSSVHLRVPRIGFAISTSLIGRKGSLIRWQFPLVPAFAITISKSQGKTFGQRLLIDLQTQCFSHGALYVALSRNTSASNIVMITESGKSTEVVNIVYTPLCVR